MIMLPVDFFLWMQILKNNPDSPDFYEANGFIRMTDKKYTKKTKIVCMYKDILPAE